jgi:hypothetical protein
MDTKEIAIQFAKYLATNWNFERESNVCAIYSSQCNCLHIQSIDEIYDEWIKDINNQTQ